MQTESAGGIEEDSGFETRSYRTETITMNPMQWATAVGGNAKWWRFSTPSPLSQFDKWAKRDRIEGC